MDNTHSILREKMKKMKQMAARTEIVCHLMRTDGSSLRGQLLQACGHLAEPEWIRHNLDMNNDSCVICDELEDPCPSDCVCHPQENPPDLSDFL